jgi:hypothetical protein
MAQHSLFGLGFIAGMAIPENRWPGHVTDDEPTIRYGAYSLGYLMAMSVGGTEAIGPLPGDLQSVTACVAAIPIGSTAPEGTQAMINFPRSPDVAELIRAKGVVPLLEH